MPHTTNSKAKKFKYKVEYWNGSTLLNTSSLTDFRPNPANIERDMWCNSRNATYFKILEIEQVQRDNEFDNVTSWNQ